MKIDPINLDAAASLGLLPEVRDELYALDRAPLNPSSIHNGGQHARHLIEKAREEVGALFGLSRDDTVIFTSGATESNNTALSMPLWNYIERHEPAHIITTAIEHPSVLEPLKRLRSIGIDWSVVSPNTTGGYIPTQFSDTVRDSTVMASIMLVNNETGQILPVQEISHSIKSFRRSVLVHTDAVQGAGKFPINFGSLGVDMMSISGHKVGALSGVGALIIRKGIEMAPLLAGGPQEVRRRAGTENVVGIISMGIACRHAASAMTARQFAIKRNGDLFRKFLAEMLPECQENFAPLERVPSIINVRFPGIHAHDLNVAIDLNGVYASSGAACASGKPEPSHVLTAMGLSHKDAEESLRFSIPHYCGEEEIREAVARIGRAVASMRRAAA